MKLWTMVGVGLVSAVTGLAVAQTPASRAANDPLAELTAEERGRFDAANKQFGAQHYAEALPVFKELLAAHPESLRLAVTTCEVAIDAGEPGFVVKFFKPIEVAHPEVWQASVMMVRAYAEMNDKVARDGEMAHLADLQKQGVIPVNITQYIVERVHLADGRVLVVWNSLVPWGSFKVVNYGLLLDTTGQTMMRMEVESADFDQPGFVKEHPEEAAAGGRRYSFDIYHPTPAGPSGKRSETQALAGFVDAKPTYDEARAAFMAIAEGKQLRFGTKEGLFRLLSN